MRFFPKFYVTCPLFLTAGILGAGAAPVLQVDIEDQSGPVDLQPGFTSYTLVEGNKLIGSLTFGVSAVNVTPNSYDDRQRVMPTAGSLTEDAIYRDFIFASNAGTTNVTGRASGLDITISGLDPGQLFEVTVWSFDQASSGVTRVSDWSVTGLGGRSQGINNYSFIGSTLPAADTDNRFTFSAVADTAGQLVVHGRQAAAAPAAGTPNARAPQVFFNGISLDQQATAYSLVDVLAVDFDGDVGAPGATQAGFEPFLLLSPTLVTGSSESLVLGGKNVTVTATGDVGAYIDDRTRIAPTNSGSLTQADILQDFIFSRAGTTNGIDVLIEDLKPSTLYRLNLWSYDKLSTGDRIADWSANGTTLWDDYILDGSVDPLTDDDHRFGNFVASDALGKILIEGRYVAGVTAIGVFLNGLQLQEVQDDGIAFDFSITSITRNAQTDEVTITWKSKPGKFYKVLFSDTLDGDPRTWADIRDNYLSQGDSTTTVDTVDSDIFGERFYVIEELP